MRIFKIEKGKHRAGYFFDPMLFPNSYMGTFSFDDGCNVAGQSDQINKLCGISLGFNHHANSIRVGWCFDAAKGDYGLYYYGYFKGKRTIELICEIRHNDKFIVYIANYKRQWYITISVFDTVKNSIIEHVYDENFIRSLALFGYRLHPYYGGTIPAPCSMFINEH